MIELLRPSQLRVLVAVVASWRVRARPPSTNELLAATTISRNCVERAKGVLMVRGLLQQDWEHGVPLERTLRPTPQAIRELEQLAPPVPVATAAE